MLALLRASGLENLMNEEVRKSYSLGVRSTHVPLQLYQFQVVKLMVNCLT